MQVCVIDDDPLMLKHLGEMLTGLGCQVVSAPDVNTAIKEMAVHQCEAAVVDILMPDRDGLNFILEIRRTRPDLRIVAISGGGRLGAGTLLGMANALGADATLVKPFSSSELKLALAAT